MAPASRVKSLTALLVAGLLNGCGNGPFHDRYSLQDLALSPDGHQIAVSFLDRDRKKNGFGLFDLEHRRFTPLTDGLHDPAFSTDGTRLAVVANNQIQLIDLATQSVSTLPTKAAGFKESPVFSPDGKFILYVATTPARLILLELETGIETPLLVPFHGFSRIARPVFGGPNQILFVASGPQDPALSDQAAQFPDSRVESDDHIYGLKFGAAPELILKNLWIEAKKRSRWFTGEHDLRGSHDASRLVFVDYAPDIKNPDKNSEQEMFLIEGSALTQLTHVKAPLLKAAISDDGSVAAFACDLGRSQSYDLCLVDLPAGTLRRPGLLSSIR